MATSAGAFFAGIGTTFVVLAVGFSGGLMIANSALKEPAGYQTRAAKEPLTPVRVILPHSAEAAQQPQHQASLPPEPQPAIQPAKPAQSPVEAQVEKADTSKREAARERKRRYAERKAKRQAEARARMQREQQQFRGREDTPIMAFGGDSSPRSGGFFGN